MWCNTNTARKKSHRLDNNPAALKVATGVTVLVILLAACGNVQPTISPDPTVTRPAITQTAPAIETHIATTEPTQPATETQAPARARMYSDMTLEGGAAQCTENLLHLDSPDYPQKLQQMFESINNQAGLPDTNVYWTEPAGIGPGTLQQLYPVATYNYQSLDPEGRAPVLTCGEVRLGDAVGRIHVVRIPFPLPGGGSEYITIGLVHEPSAELIMDEMGLVHSYTDNNSDAAVFPSLQHGVQQVRIYIYMNNYYLAGPSDMELWNAWMQERIEKSGSIIVPRLFDAQEQAHFSELLVQVFTEGNRDPEILAALKALMENQLIPGFISVPIPYSP